MASRIDASGFWASKSRTNEAMPPRIRLSPRYMTKGSPAMNSSEILTAWARPRGASWGI
ncbi:hypothetical protein D3C72_2255700 [compost metagenome]